MRGRGKKDDLVSRMILKLPGKMLGSWRTLLLTSYFLLPTSYFSLLTSRVVAHRLVVVPADEDAGKEVKYAGVARAADGRERRAARPVGSETREACREK